MQVVRLTGVLDDGTDRRRDVPLNTAKTIQLPLLSDVTIEVEVVNPQGVAVDLVAAIAVGASNFNSWFSVVRNPDSCAQASGQTDYQLASTTVKAATRNVLVFTVPASALRRFPAGRYFYDVSATLAGSKYQLVRISGLHLEAVLRQA